MRQFYWQRVCIGRTSKSGAENILQKYPIYRTSPWHLTSLHSIGSKNHKTIVTDSKNHKATVHDIRNSLQQKTKLFLLYACWQRLQGNYRRRIPQPRILNANSSKQTNATNTQLSSDLILMIYVSAGLQ